ncbi:MAG TPA: SDR family oxidoreductase [Chthonomonadales bacterium]|nr:SDR family oxidoreductase [Chthonomonadales bacterium]
MSNNPLVLITGALGDIGIAAAQKFAAHGWRLALNDVHGESAALERLSRAGGELSARYWQADNRDRDAVEAMISSMEAELGLPAVTIANAGVVLPQPFLEMTVDNLQAHLNVNLIGSFHIAQAVCRRLAATGSRGLILFTGSWVQEVARPHIPAYCISKAGLWMLAKSMALSLAPSGIRVNVVAPGNVDAGLSAQLFRSGAANRAEYLPMIPLGALQTSEQVAGAMWLMAQPEADYITGATLLADGGASLFNY